MQFIGVHSVHVFAAKHIDFDATICRYTVPMLHFPVNVSWYRKVINVSIKYDDTELLMFLAVASLTA